MIPSGTTLAIDTETCGLSTWHGDRPFIISMCNTDGETGYTYWPVNPYTRMPLVPKKDVASLRAFCENEKTTKIFFNAKFDIRMLESVGIGVRGRIDDVFFMMKVLRSDELKYGLKYLAKKYLDIDDDDEEELKKAVAVARRVAKKNGWKIAEKSEISDKPAAADYWLAPRQVALKYALRDAERTMLLYKLLNEQLDEHPSYREFYEREMVLHKVTYAMETRGICVNPETIKSEIKRCDQTMKSSLKNLLATKLVPKDFNPNSQTQVAKLVYDKLKMPVTKWTDKGSPSTDLEALRDAKHPAIQELQRYKSSEKAMTNFFQKYLNLAVEQNGVQVIHPNFKQIGPITGRYACGTPNLQNAPNATSVKAVEPIQARMSFCPREGYEWYCFDYSAQEAWIFAAGANELKMLNILLEGRDLPLETAIELWGKDVLDKEIALVGIKKSLWRIRAKMTLYGLLYGIGDQNLGKLLKLPTHEAKDIRDRYLQIYPMIGQFMEDTIRFARRNGWIATAWGRRIHLDVEYAYRAVNYYVQGSAADLIKSSMIKIHDWFLRLGVDAHIIMTIHDELVVEVAKSDVSKGLLRGIISRMGDHDGKLPAIPKLPVGVDKVTKSWNLKEHVEL